MSNELLRCGYCEQMLPLENFWKSKSKSRGYQTYCKACSKLQKRSTYSIHKIKRNAYKREWRKTDENGREYNRKYRREKPHVYAAKEQRRRTRLKNNGVYLVTEKEMQKMYASKCFYCKVADATTVDHVVPIAKGGTHSIGNLLPACRPCNESKKAKLLIEWKIERARNGNHYN